MPTGYTHNIPEGITPRQFFLQCVRAMGICTTMRDDPSDAPIPKEFEVSKHHLNALKGAETSLALLRAMTPADIEIACAKNNAERLATWMKEKAKADHTRAAYEKMLTVVWAWTPPTPEHEGFKKFMVEQITESIKYDCDSSYYKERLAPQMPGDWHKNRLEAAEGDIKYHTRNWAEEQERNAQRNAWLKAFWDSLPPEGEFYNSDLITDFPSLPPQR